MAPQPAQCRYNHGPVFHQADRQAQVERVGNLNAPRRYRQLVLVLLNAAAELHLDRPLGRGYRHHKGFAVRVMADRDQRGDLVRVRLSEQDLARVTAIQDYYEREGMRPALQAVISDAIATHYSVLEAQGSVEPNL